LPFTLAHPAAVLPLRSRYVSTAALVIGSISPDFEYFLRARLISTYSHTLPGLLFCIAAGLVVFVTVTTGLRLGLIALLPTNIRTRISTSPLHKSWFVVMGSVLAGAVTHDVWDSFTHRNGWAASRLGLAATIGGIPAYSLLQHLSTLIGVAVVTLVFVRWLRRTTVGPDPYRHFGDIRLAFAIGLIVATIGVGVVTLAWTESIGTTVVRMIDAVIVVTLAFAAAAQYRVRLSL
jgi:uncharacterized protein DUF4184